MILGKPPAHCCWLAEFQRFAHQWSQPSSGQIGHLAEEQRPGRNGSCLGINPILDLIAFKYQPSSSPEADCQVSLGPKARFQTIEAMVIIFARSMKTQFYSGNMEFSLFVNSTHYAPTFQGVGMVAMRCRAGYTASRIHLCGM